MSQQNPTIPTATAAKGIDATIVDLQTHLSFSLSWLSNGMGRAYKIKKTRSNGSVQFLPMVYLGTSKYNYFDASMDNDKQGQSIILVGDGTPINQQRGTYGILEYPVSIIFSANLSTINSTLLETEVFTEHLMENVRQALIRDMLGKPYTLNIDSETMDFDTVYSEFDINTDAGKTNKPIAPMTYFRFDTTIQIRESCPPSALDRCAAITQNLTADDKNVCILPTYDYSTAPVQTNVTAGQKVDLIDWLCVAAPVTQYSMSFDALNESINAYNKAAYSAFDWNKPFTFKIWARFTDTTATSAIIGKRTGGFVGMLFLLVGGNLRVTLRDTASTGINVGTDTTTLVNNTWYEVGFSYDGSTNASGLKISVDGVDVSTSIAQDALGGSFLNATDLSFGQSIGLYLGGQLGYIRAWDIELSAADKLADYNGGVMNETTIQAPNLVLGWKSGTGALFGISEWLTKDLADDTASPVTMNMDYSNRLLDVPV